MHKYTVYVCYFGQGNYQRNGVYTRFWPTIICQNTQIVRKNCGFQRPPIERLHHAHLQSHGKHGEGKRAQAAKATAYVYSQPLFFLPLPGVANFWDYATKVPALGQDDPSHGAFAYLC